MARPQTAWEWDVETVTSVASAEHEANEVLDHHHTTSYAEAVKIAAADPGEGLRHDIVLVRDDDIGRSWAYMENGKLPEFFTNAHDEDVAKVPKRYHDEVERYRIANRKLDSVSDPLKSAPKILRDLIERDERIVGYTIEADGCFIYTNSHEWCDDAGAGTFREDTVSAAVRKYKERVQRADGNVSYPQPLWRASNERVAELHRAAVERGDTSAIADYVALAKQRGVSLG